MISELLPYSKFSLKVPEKINGLGPTKPNFFENAFMDLKSAYDSSQKNQIVYPEQGFRPDGF